MPILNRFDLKLVNLIKPILITCLTVVPSYSFAATINVLSENLHVSLQALEETYLYNDSGFSAPEFDRIHSQTSLSNNNLLSSAPSGFSSMFWWNAHKQGNGFRFFGNANTDRSNTRGGYDPDAYSYARSIVSFDMLFAVEGDGAMLSTLTRGGDLFGPATTVSIFDLTSGTQFLGGALTSGHEYSISASAESLNGGGDEKFFQLSLLQTPKFLLALLSLQQLF
jgi:hypothetical protein